MLKSLKYYDLLLKAVSETTSNGVKEKKEDLVYCQVHQVLLTGKGTIKTGKGTTGAGYASKRFLIKDFEYRPINFEIQKYHQNEHIFNGVYSRDNLQDKIKDEEYITNLEEYSDIGTH